MRRLRVVAVLLSGVSGAYGIGSIPQESGVSGFVNLGLAAGQVESNTIAKVISVGLSDEGINDLNRSPNDETVLVPLAAAELSYTFADTRTQIFLGTLLEDFVRFDSSTRAGIRQALGSAGVASFSLLANSPAGAKVWKDPYRTTDQGVRKSTGRDTEGIRLAWGEIFGTGLEIRYSRRDIALDDDQAGESQVIAGRISAEEQRLLRRDGDVSSIELRYSFAVGENTLVDISSRYRKAELNGDAMAYDGYSAGFSWIRIAQQWRYVLNLGYGQFEAEQDNPVFDQAGDYTHLGGSFTVFYNQPFDLKGWNANVGVIYFQEDNGINFHDQSAGFLQLGMLYRL